MRNEDGFYGSHGSPRVLKSKSPLVEISNINWTITVHENGDMEYKPNSRTHNLEVNPVTRVTKAM